MSDGEFINTLHHAIAPYIGFVITIAVFFWRLGKIEKREVGPQPFVTKRADEFVPLKAFHNHTEANRVHHEQINARISSLERQREADKDAIILAGEERAKAIHDSINVVIEKVGELRGEVKHLSHGGQS